MPCALVTGATGRIGSHVVDVLVEQDWDVRALCLPDDEGIAGLVDRGVEIAEGSLIEKNDVLRALQGVTDVFHLGAALTTRGALPAYMFEVIARGTFNLVDGIRQLESTDMRLLFVSSTSVYFSGLPCPFPGVECDETTPIAPSTVYGAAKRAGELLVETAAQSGWCSASIVRPGDTADSREILAPESVFGRRWFVQGAIGLFEASNPGDPDRINDGVYEQLLEQKGAELFFLVDPQGREVPVQISDARSAAQSMVEAIGRARHGTPDVANLVASRSWTMGEIVRSIGDLAGISDDRLARIEVDDIGGYWQFGTSTDHRITDVLTILRDSSGTDK